MNHATRIASRISHTVEACLQSNSCLETLSKEVKDLWEEAKGLGVQEEVDSLLQEDSRKEMEEALLTIGY